MYGKFCKKNCSAKGFGDQVLIFPLEKLLEKIRPGNPVNLRMQILLPIVKITTCVSLRNNRLMGKRSFHCSCHLVNKFNF